MRTVIIDDEQPARELIRALLAAWPSIDIVGEAADFANAVRLFETVSPELAFLDVQMPGGSGFDVLMSVPPDRLPLIIFTTAYDQYALRAFEVSACDYLLKPSDAARLAKALTRVLNIETRGEQIAQRRLLTLLGHLNAPPSETVTVKAEGRHLFVRTSDIHWIEAVGKTVRFHTAGGAIEARETMSSVEARLNRTQFVRVHRSAIVNANHVAQIQPWFQGNYVLILRNGSRVVSGRTHRAAVQSLIRR